MRFAHILLSAAVAHAAAVTFAVECSGNSDYTIDGKQDPPLIVAENDEVTFTIDGSCSPSHPFQLQDADGNAIEPTLVGSTDEVVWNVPAGAATYKYVCIYHPAMTNTITATAALVADAPADFAAVAQSATSASLSWTAGQQLNGCTWESWAVKAINSANNASVDATGCQGLTELETSCDATGLIDGASYWFSVQMVCQQPALSSALATTQPISLAVGSPVVSVVATATSPTTATLAWTRAAFHGGCELSTYEVMTSDGMPVQGCTSVKYNTSCTATRLTPGMAYSFTVKEVCVNPAFNSNVTTSNTITTLPGVLVNVTCDGTTAFKLNGAANANVTITQGDVLVFVLDASCTSSPLEIATTNGSMYTTGVTFSPGASTARLQVETSAATPTTLRYLSTRLGDEAMGGFIIVKLPPTKAGRPTISASSDTDTPTVVISWIPGNAGECEFLTWLVEDENGASVEGCTAFPNASVTTCTATGLAGATDYRFTVQRVCKNPLANSPVSALSSRVTTISAVGIKICQGDKICNCGNATICTCQLTEVCNCDFADKCICQGGKCNGGNANFMICQSTDCNKQCAKSCPSCIGDALSGLFGSKSCVSSSIAVSASGILLAALSLFAF